MDLENIAPLIEENIKKALAEKRYPFGIKTRPGISNKIASSSLYNSVQVNQSGNDTLEVLMNDYWKYVQSGRLPGKKGVPIEAIENIFNDNRIIELLGEATLDDLINTIEGI